MQAGDLRSTICGKYANTSRKNLVQSKMWAVPLLVLLSILLYEYFNVSLSLSSNHSILHALSSNIPFFPSFFYFLQPFSVNYFSFTITFLFLCLFISCFICFLRFILCWSVSFPQRIWLIHFFFVLSFVPLVFISTALWLLTYQLMVKSKFLTPTSYHPAEWLDAVSCEVPLGEYYLKPLCLYCVERLQKLK
jgi:hypothetical protein